jgi:hypothetical protein
MNPAEIDPEVRRGRAVVLRAAGLGALAGAVLATVLLLVMLPIVHRLTELTADPVVRTGSVFSSDQAAHASVALALVGGLLGAVVGAATALVSAAVWLMVARRSPIPWHAQLVGATTAAVITWSVMTGLGLPLLSSLTLLCCLPAVLLAFILSPWLGYEPIEATPAPTF